MDQIRFILPVESIVQNKGGVILYDPVKNKILNEYIHDKKWTRVGWRGGKVYGDYLIATDWSDLHYFDIKKWKYVKSFKWNTFNDLHYVEVKKDKLFIVNTGLDAIEIFKDPIEPKFIKRIFLFNACPKLFDKREFDLKDKFNKKMKVKPHSAHPNCISFLKDKIFVTCFDKKNKVNTGEVVGLNTGEKILKGNFDCHDGIFYDGDFYLTWTRHAQILKFNNLKNRKFPIKPDERIKINGRGWWRGMIIHDGKFYVFASDGYKKRKTTLRMVTIDIKTGERNKVKLPVFSDVYWDTVYQPNLLLEDN
jgi:hypothetical protein